MLGIFFRFNREDGHWRRVREYVLRQPHHLEPEQWLKSDQSNQFALSVMWTVDRGIQVIGQPVGEPVVQFDEIERCVIAEVERVQAMEAERLKGAS